SAADNASSEFDAGGGNMQPIPSDTNVLAAIDEAKWSKNQKGDEFISLRWTVIAPEDFANRKIFQKLWVTDFDPSVLVKGEDKALAKRDKAKRMLAAIDTNAGGKLLAKPVMPTDESMTLHLTNKPMIVKVMVWEMTDRMTGDVARGNWVGAVSSKANGKVSSPDEIAKSKSEMANHQSKAAGAAARGGRNLDDEIPF
ncbi:MAG: hypothetical protein JZU63_09980, partial [Rhodoferax sp.]|nr:hypothetical protein [Rhodoferax sp.]